MKIIISTAVILLLGACAVSPEYAAGQEAERACKHLINADKEYKKYAECKLNTYGAIYPIYEKQAERDRADMADLSAAIGEFGNTLSSTAAQSPRTINCTTTKTMTGSISRCY